VTRSLKAEDRGERNNVRRLASTVKKISVARQIKEPRRVPSYEPAHIPSTRVKWGPLATIKSDKPAITQMAIREMAKIVKSATIRARRWVFFCRLLSRNFFVGNRHLDIPKRGGRLVQRLSGNSSKFPMRAATGIRENYGSPPRSLKELR